MCPANGSTAAFWAPGQLRGIAATGEPWSCLNVTGRARGMGAQINRSRGARCSLNFVHLNFVLLPNCLTRAHNQKATGRGNVVKNLFVGNLGSEVTHEEPRLLLEAYGGEEQVHVVLERDTGRPRVYACLASTMH